MAGSADLAWGYLGSWHKSGREFRLGQYRRAVSLQPDGSGHSVWLAIARHGGQSNRPSDKSLHSRSSDRLMDTFTKRCGLHILVSVVDLTLYIISSTVDTVVKQCRNY